METRELLSLKLDELKPIFEEESKKATNQFSEWWDIFEIISICKKLDLSELHTHAILSNRFEIIRRK